MANNLLSSIWKTAMYNPDEKKLGKYMSVNGEFRGFDVHAWLKDLSVLEKEELLSEVLSAQSRSELSPYAVQFYGHFCEQSDDKKLHQIEHDFVTAQIEERPPDEIAKIEDVYFERARELMKLQKNQSINDK